MGSYGIGVERVIACYIEQHNDEKGIVWSTKLAPYKVHLLALNMKSELISGTANGIYEELRKAGVEVLFDDRSEVSAGVKFNDADLLGMPVQVIIGEKKFKTGQVEFKIRATQERKDIPLEEVVKECVNFEF